MNGILVVDKPAGPTSHDVVQRMRRVLRERSIGHTGTLDPMATGVLVLVLGRATRLARFLSASDKSYEATITLGVSTTTYDGDGEPVGAKYHGPLPARAEIDAALDAFRGTFLQQPPAYSAKKVGGERSYNLARAGTVRALPEPVEVTAAVEVALVDGEHIALRVDCSAGFYVRSLAHDLGQALGTGAHLSALRRVRSGEFTLAGALVLDDADLELEEIEGFIIPMGQVLTTVPAVVLTAEGVIKASHGRDVAASDFASSPFLSPPAPSPPVPSPQSPFVRLLDRDGGLVGVAERTDAPGLLHPAVVLV